MNQLSDWWRTKTLMRMRSFSGRISSFLADASFLLADLQIFRGWGGSWWGKVPEISKLYTPTLFLGRSHSLKSQLACLHLHNQYAGLVQMWAALVGCFPHQDQLHPHYILPVLVLDIWDICQLKFKTFKIISLFKYKNLMVYIYWEIWIFIQVKEDNFGIHFEFKDIWVGGGMGDVDIFCGF